MRKRGKRITLLSLILLSLILALISLVYSNVASSLSIPITGNTPPYFLQNIPTQEIPVNSNKTNAFDLDDYFFDSEDVMTYNFTQPENITIIFNQTTNQISFFPDLYFIGKRNLTFFASDGEYTTSSNLVIVNVTPDTTPPFWYTMNVSSDEIYQNDIVTFMVTWEDNIYLSNFVLSLQQVIDKTTQWVNHTGTFTGTKNVSSIDVKISSPPETEVRWMFYAYDSAGNMNFTDIKYFYIKKYPSSISNNSQNEGISSRKEEEQITEKIRKFTLEPSSIKISMKEGEIVTRFIKITNVGEFNDSFTIDFNNINEFIIINERNFSLSPKESKTIALDFKVKRRTIPDLYFGEIIIKNKYESQKIPVILEIKPTETIIDLNVSVINKKINAGENVSANISIINFKDLIKENATLYIAIKDFQGNTLDSNSEEFLFENDYYNFIKTLSIPQNSPQGDYIYFARLIKNNLIVIDSDDFQVGEKIDLSSYFKINLLILLLILLIIIIVFFMIRYKMNKTKARLLKLYLKVNDMKNLLDKGKVDEAIQIYAEIKSNYGEEVAKTTLENKEDLKKEIQKLYSQLAPEIKKIQQENKDEKKQPLANEEKKENEKKQPLTNEDKKENEKKQPLTNEDKKENEKKQ